MPSKQKSNDLSSPKEGPDYDEYIESLACTIADYLENGYDHFISGMALGVDMDFAETVIQFREHYDLDVKLECTVPCPNQTLKWSPAETARYKAILNKTDKATMVNTTTSAPVCSFGTIIW